LKEVEKIREEVADEHFKGIKNKVDINKLIEETEKE